MTVGGAALLLLAAALVCGARGERRHASLPDTRRRASGSDDAAAGSSGEASSVDYPHSLADIGYSRAVDRDRGGGPGASSFWGSRWGFPFGGDDHRHRWPGGGSDPRRDGRRGADDRSRDAADRRRRLGDSADRRRRDGDADDKRQETRDGGFVGGRRGDRRDGRRAGGGRPSEPAGSGGGAPRPRRSGGAWLPFLGGDRRRGGFPFFAGGDRRRDGGRGGRDRRGRFPLFIAGNRRDRNDGSNAFTFFRHWRRNVPPSGRGDRERDSGRFPYFGWRNRGWNEDAEFPFFRNRNGSRRRTHWSRGFPSIFGNNRSFFFGSRDRGRRRDRGGRDDGSSNGRDSNRRDRDPRRNDRRDRRRDGRSDRRRDDRRDRRRDDRRDRRRDDRRDRGPADRRDEFDNPFFARNFTGFSRPLPGRNPFGVFSENGNTTFVGFRGDGENVCVERRNYTRRAGRPDTQRHRRSGHSASCTATAGTQICVSTNLRDGVVRVEERISRCCPGSVPTRRGCRRRRVPRALEQLKQLKHFAFLDLVKRAGMQRLLVANVTLFVPTDAAVADFVARRPTVQDRANLARFVGAHVVDDNLPLPLLALRSPVRSRSGPVWVSVGPRGLLVNCAPLLSRDRPTPSGGVIHTIDGVLRSEGRTTLQAIKARPQLSTLFTLLQKTGLAAAMTNWTSITFLAPTNAAFKAAKLPTNPQQLKEVLRVHVLSGLQCLAGLPGVGLDGRGQPVFLWRRRRRLTIVPRLQRQAAVTVTVTRADLVTRDGLLHVIGQVVLPPFARATLYTLSRFRDTALFARLLTETGLAGVANGDNVTLLVPPARLLANRSTSPAELRVLLESHLLRGGASRLSGGSVYSVSGRPLLVTAGLGEASPELVQCTAVVGRLDLGKPSVAVLGVAGVLRPADHHLLALIRATPGLSNFRHVLALSGVSRQLRSSGANLTVLAPHNSGLTDVRQLRTPAAAAKFVRVHVIRGSICRGALGPSLTPYRRLDNGALLAAASARGATFAPLGTSAAAAVGTRLCDLVATNGVLHVLERPLEGPGADTDPFSPRSALRFGLH